MAASLHLVLFKHRRELRILGCEDDGIEQHENLLLHGVNVLHVLDEFCAKLILLIHIRFLLALILFCCSTETVPDFSPNGRERRVRAIELRSPYDYVFLMGFGRGGPCDVVSLCFLRYESRTTKALKLHFSALLSEDGARDVRFERALGT